MSLPPVAPNSVFIHTLGCPKNDADSRSLARMLTSAGARVVDDPTAATFILINTCGFIQDAKEESIGAVLDACAQFGGDRVLVTGCLVERYMQDLRTGIPEVADWFGLGDTERLVARVSGAPPASREASGVANRELPPLVGGVTSHAPAVSYAYIKISDGCDELCSFCAIPGIKGPYYSVAPEQVVAEARGCLTEGARELVLVGQDTAVWRYGSMGLVSLIDRLAAEEAVKRIRLMYLQPEHVSDGLLAYMASHPKVCRYLDLPFQHAHPDVLKRMNRWGDGGDYRRLVDKARRLMPDVSVRSTFIVGFPGETEEQFETLLDFVKDVGFDHAGGFVYSPEEGTPAEALRPRIRRSVAAERLNRLTTVLVAEAERRHRLLVGSRVEVMIDSMDPAECGEGMTAVGRTAGQAPEVDGVTYIEGLLPPNVGVGDIVTVRVTDAMAYDLVGVHGEA
jgi:ribosomal protein S12 methylthiotransferase